MGTWGTKLYQDDLALDIKEDYIEKLKQGLSNEEALEEILKENKETIEDYDEGPVFWLVLADTMWRTGRLTKEIKEKALQSIEQNLKIWEENKKQYEARKSELNQLKEKINSPMPEEKMLYIPKKEKKKISKQDYKWNIGDVYAYKITEKEAIKNGYAGKYFIIRKVEEYPWQSIRTSFIAYCQITENENLPKTQEEIEKLGYVIIINNGNIEYDYKIGIYGITQKNIRENLIYIGNFKDIKNPSNEYIEKNISNIQITPFKDIENYMLHNIDKKGTSQRLIYLDINPRNIMDSRIRFLMREKYYEETLEIYPQKGSTIKQNPLLYISLVDSMMIGGIVDNPIGIVNDEIKQEAYKRIEELKNIIIKKQDKKKEEKIKILDGLKEKIEKYQFENPFAKI